MYNIVYTILRNTVTLVDDANLLKSMTVEEPLEKATGKPGHLDNTIYVRGPGKPEFIFVLGSFLSA